MSCGDSEVNAAFFLIGTYNIGRLFIMGALNIHCVQTILPHTPSGKVMKYRLREDS